MLFAIHARRDGISTRAKFYRAHRIHLYQAERYNVDVVTAGTLVADDGETPVGSIFVIDAKDRNAVDTFARSDPYHANSVWETVQIHAYNKKRGTPIQSRRSRGGIGNGCSIRGAPARVLRWSVSDGTSQAGE